MSALFEVGDFDETIGIPVEEVRVDPHRGHIALLSSEDRAQALHAFVDLGPVLHVWGKVGANLSPAMARVLAEALQAWADRADGRRCGHEASGLN